MGDEWEWARYHNECAEALSAEAAHAKTAAIRARLLELSAGYKRLALDAEATAIANEGIDKARAAYRASKFRH